MTRLHYGARAGGMKSPATVYRGVPTNRPTGRREVVEPGEGQVRCPVCGGAARVIKAQNFHINRELGVREGDRIYGKHVFGGGKKHRLDPDCTGAGTPVIQS